MQRQLIRISIFVLLAICVGLPATGVSFASDANSLALASPVDYINQTRAKLTGAGPALDSHAADGARFMELWSGATDGDPDFGPFMGSLEHIPNEVSIADPDVSVSDFAAHIVCSLPGNLNPTFHWDCGFEFRGIREQPHYRLVVTSQGYWAFLIDQTRELAYGEGLVALTGDRMTIDLVAAGDVAAFAVNGEFVSTLDISSIPGPGTVAAGTSFYGNTAIPGGNVRYADFTIWTLDSTGKSKTPAADANSYTSPDHGFRLSWDETWFVVSEPLNADEELALTSQRAEALISTTKSASSSATDCFAGIIEKYRSDPAYSNVAILTTEHGGQVMTPGDEVASALLRYDYTVNGGQLTTEAFDYVLCAMLPDGQTIVQLEQFVPADGFISVKGEMETLQSSLLFDDGRSVAPPGLPAFTLGSAPPTAHDIKEFERLVAEIARTQSSNLAPEQLALEVTGTDFALWNAGVTIGDFALHAELAPVDRAGNWNLIIEFRSVNSMSQYLSISSDATFSTFDAEGNLEATPERIDLIVVGEDGYVGLDGRLVAVLDLADWMVEGDIVIAAVSPHQAEDSTTEIAFERLSILDLSGGISFLLQTTSKVILL